MAYGLLRLVLSVVCVHVASGACFGSANTISCTTIKELHQFTDRTWQNLILNNTGTANAVPFELNINVFSNFPGVQSIRIDGTIAKLSPGVFSRLPQLLSIAFYNSNLTVISVGVFNGLPVRAIGFRFSGITGFSPGCFQNSTELNGIIAHGNVIPTVHTGIFNGLLITRLFLTYNWIQLIEDLALEDMVVLYHLDLSQNSLEGFNVRRVMYESPSLQTLILDSNRIKILKRDSFSGAPNLVTISLNHNEIETIESGTFSNLVYLKQLYLNLNKLQVLHPTIFGLGNSNLTLLSVHRNQLTYLQPAFMQRMPLLEKLCLGGNPWMCPCWDELKSWAPGGCTFDEDYVNGNRPSCVISVWQRCIYSSDYGEDTKRLQQYYINKMTEYDLP